MVKILTFQSLAEVLCCNEQALNLSLQSCGSHISLGMTSFCPVLERTDVVRVLNKEMKRFKSCSLPEELFAINDKQPETAGSRTSTHNLEGAGSAILCK